MDWMIFFWWNKTIKINFTVVFPECFRLYFSIVLKLYWETVKHDFLSGTLPLGGIYKSTWKRKGKYLSKWTNFDSDIKQVFNPVMWTLLSPRTISQIHMKRFTCWGWNIIPSRFFLWQRNKIHKISLASGSAHLVNTS